METIDTIITNAQSLSQAHIDWSPTAGPIWLAGMMAGVAILAVWAGVSESRRDRSRDRQALYRQAERVGALRSSVRETV